VLAKSVLQRTNILASLFAIVVIVVASLFTCRRQTTVVASLQLAIFPIIITNELAILCTSGYAKYFNIAQWDVQFAELLCDINYPTY
jgi:hypothetical protein